MIAGPVIVGPVIVGPVIASPVIASPVIASTVQRKQRQQAGGAPPQPRRLLAGGRLADPEGGEHRVRHQARRNATAVGRGAVRLPRSGSAGTRRGADAGGRTDPRHLLPADRAAPVRSRRKQRRNGRGFHAPRPRSRHRAVWHRQRPHRLAARGPGAPRHPCRLARPAGARVLDGGAGAGDGALPRGDRRRPPAAPRRPPGRVHHPAACPAPPTTTRWTASPTREPPAVS